MADHVAFGKMPKQPIEMTDPQREAMVGALIDALWTDPAARAEAADYYLRQDRGLPVEPIDSAFRLIARGAAGPSDGAATDEAGSSSGLRKAGMEPTAPASEGEDDGKSWGLLERSLLIDQASFTPSFAAATALEALRVCRARPAKGEGRHLGGAGKIQQCLEQAMSPDLLIRGRVH